MTSLSPKVCIILVNYNGYEDTVDCVKSIVDCKYDNYKIVIVDNGSKDTSQLKNDTFLNEHADIIYSKINTGFSEGNNIGMKEAQKYNPEYILLLNNDTVVKQDFLNKMVNVAEANESIGIVTSVINYYYDKEMTWYNVGNYNKLIGYTSMLGNVDNKFKEKYLEVSFSTGCLMLIRNEIFQKYGGLSNEYFLYSEDTDFCLKVMDKGYKIVSVPEVLIYHKVNGSTGTGSDLQQYYLTRNYLIVAKKYGTCFLFAYIFRWLLSQYEIIRYHYDRKVIKRAFKDFKQGVKGKVEIYK